VLAYPKIARILRWKRVQIERLLKQIYLRSVMVEIEATATTESLRDPDDSSILLSLLSAQAEHLVIGDADLLVLRDRYPIVTPAEFAARL
jgi:uncharacterized protein